MSVPTFVAPTSDSEYICIFRDFTSMSNLYDILYSVRYLRERYLRDINTVISLCDMWHFSISFGVDNFLGYETSCITSINDDIEEVLQ